eukprot:TRINITY_DN30186_c0_g1_i2.p1 TRINITY_DN30186_c0_g1~~TRINITY_DN30186_c0_g1_i2.p1  ORF type:complete len:129 (-),score=29.77 TRINITY_DN30186_c0_g1_i2:120-506(-)
MEMVTVQDVISVLKELELGEQKEISTLPSSQKIILWSVVVATRTKEICALKDVYLVYSKLCHKNKFERLESSQFANLCDLLVTMGLICWTNPKKAIPVSMESKILLSVSESFIEDALREEIGLRSLFC